MEVIKQVLSSIIFSAVCFCFASTPITLSAQHRDDIHITENTTWSGNVNVSADTYIDEGVTLTINPGSTITFTGFFGLRVIGNIIAEGSATDSIYFLPSNQTTGWNRVFFELTPPGSDSSKFSHCSFKYGKAISNSSLSGEAGGAMYLNYFGKISIQNCLFKNNYALALGGALDCNYSSPLIINNIFDNNSSGLDAGAIELNHANPRIIGNLFTNNQTSANGGALNFAYSSPHVTNNTFADNNAGYRGGAISIDIDSEPIFTNCIFYSNFADVDGNEVSLTSNAGDPDFYYCLASGGVEAFGGDGAAGYSGNYENNIDADPKFAGTGEQPYNIMVSSPCLNTGKPDLSGLNLPALDLAGNPRVAESCSDRIDIGAYESQSQSSNSFSGILTEDALWCADTVRITGNVSVNDGITLTIGAGTVIYVAGDYYIDIKGCLKAIGNVNDSIFFTTDNIWPYWYWGGMKFNDIQADNDSSILRYCRFNLGSPGNFTGGAISIDSWDKIEISNCWFYDNNAERGGAIAINNSSIKLNNCLLSNNTSYVGAGLYASNSTLEILDCTFSGNKAENGVCYHSLASHGGGTYINNCTSTISNCTFTNNKADCSGGGIYYHGQNLQLQNNNINNNQASMGGGIYLSETSGEIYGNDIGHNTGDEAGGMAVSGGSLTISKNRITNNYASFEAAMYLSNCNPNIIINLIANNHAGTAGGGITFNNASPLLLNNTICDNHADNYAGCLHFSSNSNSSPEFRNCIIYGNYVIYYDGDNVYMHDNTGQPDFYYCDLEGGTDGFGGSGTSYTGVFENNLDTDPLFKNTGDYPYQLTKFSPCLNTADPSTTSATAGTTDLAGNERILNGRIDMGCYENERNADSYPGDAIHFTEVDDLVVLENESNFDFTESFTIEFWMNCDNMTEDDHLIIKKGDTWAVNLFYTQEIAIPDFSVDSNGVFGYYETTGTALLNKWNHLAGVCEKRDGGGFDVRIYFNGQAGTNDIENYLMQNNSPITIGKDFLGKIDELRIWDKALSEQEIRESMHLMISPEQENLIIYHQFNQNFDGVLVDIAGGNNGILRNMDVQECFVESTVPAARGWSNTQIVNSTGNIDFPGTGLSMDFSFLSSTGTFVVSRLDTVPNTDPPDANQVFEQYWIVEKYDGANSFDVDLTFSVIQELTPFDETHHDYSRLYSRESNSDGNWNFVDNASSINASENTIKFEDIYEFSQFCVPRKLVPDGYAGNALNFDGGDEFVAIAPLYETCPEALTIEAWIYPEVLESASSYIFYHGDNGEIELVVNDQYITFRVKLTNNTWYNLEAQGPDILAWQHLTAVWNNEGTLKIYNNGRLVASRTIPALLLHDPGNNYLPSIGSYARESNYFNGKMDEIRVWNVARTCTQIRENMHLTTIGSETGLIGDWQFNELSGMNTEDHAGNHDGDLQNMDNSNRVSSSIPAGGGNSKTQIVSSTGTFDFSDTGIQMDVSGQSGTDTIVVTRIDTTANMLPEVDTCFSGQYWVINKFGNGSPNVDLQFSVYGNITQYDESYPQNLALLKRASTSDKPWIFSDQAINANADDDNATFGDITTFGQFSVGKGIKADIALNRDSLIFDRTPSTIEVADSILIANHGTDILQITSITHDNSQFELSAKSFDLLSGEEQWLNVSFHPATDGMVYDTLRISSNSPDESIIKITVRGDAFVIDKWAGSTLQFNGTSKYVEIADNHNLDLTNNYTIEAWIYPESFTYLAGIVSKYQSSGANGYYVRLLDSSPYTGLYFDGKKTSEGILEANKWYHIAAVNNNGTRILYLNGIAQTLSGTVNTIHSNSDPLCIGVDFLEDPRYFHGKIDEVRIWNVVRTEQEIRENIHLTLKGNEAGLVGYWQLNEGSGTNTAEKINELNGTLHHFEGSDWVESTIPAGAGSSSTQEVSTTGTVDFSGTGVEMDFTEKTGTDQIVVSRIDTSANINPGGQNRPFDQQFWVVNQYGTGSFNSDITFTVIQDLTPLDEAHLDFTRLYTRDSNSEDVWTFVENASSINATLNKATFEDIDQFSQFCIPRKQVPDASLGNALDFKGTDDYVNCGTNPQIISNNPRTIEAWAYVESFNGAGIFQAGKPGADREDFSLRTLYADDEWRIQLWGSDDFDLTLAGSKNSWHHYALTYDGNTVKLYFDGELKASVDVILVTEINDVFFGRWRDYYFDGKIDEVRSWNIARTQTELRENMHRTLSRNESGLIGYWQFNKSSGTIAADKWLGNDGTLMNMIDDDWVESGALWKRWEAGAKDNVWGTAANWSTTFSPPIVNDMVLIQSGGTQPTILNEPETPALSDKLKIESTATLTLNAGKALTVFDSIFNEGGISGLILKSDESGTASLIHANVEVYATVERYIPKYVGAAGWHDLSSPVAAQAIRTDFVPNENPIPGSNDFYKYDELTDYWINTKDDNGNWNSNFEDNFVVGRGYNVAYAENEIKTFAGELNVGDFIFDETTTPAITFTAGEGNGWNLMGNPYPSALDWDQCTKENIDGAVYTYDGDAGQYKAWSAGIGNLTDGIIPPMNGFFIKASANPELTIPNSARVHTSTNFYKEKEYVEDLLVLKVEGNGFSDQTFIHFDGDASNEFDSDFDAYKLSGISEAPQLYTKVGDSKLSINVLPYTSEEIVIPLSLKVGNETEYIISVSENTFWETVDISLKDLESGNIYDLKTNTQLTINQSTTNPDRFLLLINGATAIEETTPNDGIEIFSYGNQIFIKTDRLGEVQVAVYNLLGQTVLHRTLTGFLTLSEFTTAKPGFYLVMVKTNEAMKVKKVFVK